MSFSPTEAAFSGFTFIRREWPAVIAWAAVRIAVAIVMMTIVAVIAADDLTHLATLTLAGPEQLADPSELIDLARRLGPIPVVAWLIGLLLESTLIAAFYRAYLRPQQSRFAFLRFGKAELAVAGAMLLWWVIFYAVLFLFTFTVLIAETLPALLAAVVAALALIGLIVGLIWAIVRSSLILVDSFAMRKVSLRHSFELTRGHFWPLTGAYVMGMAVTVVLSVAALGLFTAIAAVAALAAGEGLGSVGRAFNPDSGALALTFSAALVVYIIYSAVTGACSYPLVLGPTAEAYLAFKDQAEPKPAPPPFREEDDSGAQAAQPEAPPAGPRPDAAPD